MDEILTAIRLRRLLRFQYDGLLRVVIPVAYGTHVRTGKAALRAMQTAGNSSRGSLPVWRLFSEDKIIGVTVLEESFAENPVGYRRGDKDLKVLVEL